MKIQKILNENKTETPALVIVGFPGIDKSHFQKSKKDSKILDSDSSKFSWKDEKNNERNPDFPTNYITHIKENLNKADIILVSTHAVVREALEKNNIDYLLVYPLKRLKPDYIERYTERGSDEKFIKFISDGWDDMIDNLKKETHPEHSTLKKGNI